MVQRKTTYIIQFLLYCPRVYAGLDHLMVELSAQAAAKGSRVVCVYCDTMEGMPQIQQDIEAAGGIVEVISGEPRQQRRDIWRLYRRYKPAVVNTHFEMRAKLCTGVYSILFGAKHFTYVHSLLGDVAQYRQTKGLVRRCVLGVYYGLLTALSREVFCASEAIRREYMAWEYGRGRNVRTMYIGTQLLAPRYTQAQARELIGLPLDARIVANVSAIEPIKGIDLIIKAVEQLKQRGEKVLFVHIGGLRAEKAEQREYAVSLRRLAEQIGVADEVVWLGRRTDVQDILPLADVYVHPSYSEGLGSVLLEASMAGLPLVGTKVGGISEVVVEKQTGVLVKAGDVCGLAQSIEYALQHPEMGDRACQYVCRYFDQQKQTQEILKHYIEQ